MTFLWPELLWLLLLVPAVIALYLLVLREKKKSAEVLGISLKTLYTRLKSYGPR